MNKFEALSQTESDDNDLAVGLAGERSRYQITEKVWRENTSLPFSDAVKPAIALWVVEHLMVFRVSDFYERHHRMPNDYEWYLIYSCPSEVEHPSKTKSETATRFANLAGS